MIWWGQLCCKSMNTNRSKGTDLTRRQMRGRAGRKGKDEIGESYVCCQKDDVEEVEQLLETTIPPISSCLTPEKRGLKR